CQLQGLLPLSRCYQISGTEFVITSPAAPVRQLHHRAAEIRFVSDRLVRDTLILSGVSNGGLGSHNHDGRKEPPHTYTRSPLSYGHLSRRARAYRITVCC